MSELNCCYVNVIYLHTILAAGRRLSYVAATLWEQVGPTGSEPVPASLGRALVRRAPSTFPPKVWKSPHPLPEKKI